MTGGCATSTTTVNGPPIPKKSSKEAIQVRIRDGSRELTGLFARKPLLCDVSIRQNNGKVFDFRCAVVHLQKPDVTFNDTGAFPEHVPIAVRFINGANKNRARRRTPAAHTHRRNLFLSRQQLRSFEVSPF